MDGPGQAAEANVLKGLPDGQDLAHLVRVDKPAPRKKYEGDVKKGREGHQPVVVVESPEVGKNIDRLPAEAEPGMELPRQGWCFQGKPSPWILNGQPVEDQEAEPGARDGAGEPLREPERALPQSEVHDEILGFPGPAIDEELLKRGEGGGVKLVVQGPESSLPDDPEKPVSLQDFQDDTFFVAAQEKRRPLFLGQVGVNVVFLDQEKRRLAAVRLGAKRFRHGLNGEGKPHGA